jgi:hypothetical protein
MMSREVRKGDSPDLPMTPGEDQRPPSNELDDSRQEGLAEEIMRDDREVLKQLAK